MFAKHATAADFNLTPFFYKNAFSQMKDDRNRTCSMLMLEVVASEQCTLTVNVTTSEVDVTFFGHFGLIHHPL